MQLVLRGAIAACNEGESKTFGRADCNGPDAQNVSRQQFSISMRGGSCFVKSLSVVHPTKVLRAGPPPKAVVLRKGEELSLQPGDAVLLNALDSSQRVTLCDGTQQSQRDQNRVNSSSMLPQQQEHLQHKPQEGQSGKAEDGHRQKRLRLDNTNGIGRSGSLGDTDTAPQLALLAAMAGAAPVAAGPGTTAAPYAALAAATAGQRSMPTQQAPAAAAGPSNAAPGQALAAAAATAPNSSAADQAEPQAAPAQPPPGPLTGAVMLVLVGVQGSGKSTFSQQLMEVSAREWARINQDSIKGGRRGNKEMCMSAARWALAAGSSVIVDRTNIDPAQRQPFVQLARQCGAEVHCVVLRLPVKTCMARAAGRQGHEGGLQGKGAYGAVNMMHSAYMKAGPPTEAEGFQSILVCESDAEVAAALQAWSTFGVGHRDPAATWRQLAPPRKVPAAGKAKGSIESFFKKKVPALALASAPANQQGTSAGAGKSMAQGARAGAGRSGIGAASVQQKAQQVQQQGADGAQRAQQQEAGGSGQGQAQQRSAAQAPQQQQQQEQLDRPGSASGSQKNAFAVLMASSKQAKSPTVASQPSGSSSKAAASGGQREAGPAEAQPSRHKFSLGFPAARVLMNVAADPEKHAKGAPSSQQAVLIPDKYPKAKFHSLVVARDPRLQGPLDLRASDISLVEHMLEMGRGWAEQQQLAGGDRPAFSYGFHAKPSIRQLHLHVISQDLDSPCLTTKKHYLSFSTPFFLPASAVLAELQRSGQLTYDLEEKEELLKGTLRCHHCGATLPNMPGLKEHVRSCRRAVQ